jgi:hypothetical protein
LLSSTRRQSQYVSLSPSLSSEQQSWAPLFPSSFLLGCHLSSSSSPARWDGSCRQVAGHLLCQSTSPFPSPPLLLYSSSLALRQSGCSHGALPSSHISHGAPTIFSLSYLLLPWRPRPACQLYVFCCVCFQLQLVIEVSASLNPCLLILLQHCMPSVRLNASKVRLPIFLPAPDLSGLLHCGLSRCPGRLPS